MAENKQEYQKTPSELRQEENERYEEIKDELKRNWEAENGPIAIELTEEEREKRKQAVEKGGGVWNEKYYGFDYTPDGYDFLFGHDENSLRTQVEKVYQERYGNLNSGEELKPDEEFNLAPPSDSGDEVDQRDPLKLNSSDELGLDKDLSSAELESSFLSVPGSGSDLSKELSEDIADEKLNSDEDLDLDANSSSHAPENEERWSKIVDLEEQDKRFQETHRDFVGGLYKGIKEDVIARFEEEQGPIKRELNDEEKKRKKRAIEKEGGTWDEFEDGIEYTEAGKKFLFGKGSDSLESLADAEFLKDHPYYAEDLKSWKETRANLKERENTEESEQISEAGETLVNAGETLIEKAKEKRERDPDLPKSKKLVETLKSLDSDEKIKFLQKFRDRKASVLVKDENGNKTRQYLRLRDGDEFNVFEYTFEFFDENGNKVLNKDGSPKTKTQKISDIKYRDWEKGKIQEGDLGQEFLYKNNRSGESQRVRFSVDHEGDYIALDSYLTIPQEEMVKYEDEEGNVVYSESIERRSLSDTEKGKVEKLKSEHDNLVNEIGGFCYDRSEQYKKENKEFACNFFEKRLAEVRNYDNSTIVDRIKKSDIEPWRIKEEISVLSERLKQYKKQAEIFDQQSVVKKVEEKKEAQPENVEDSVEAIEEEISRLIDNYSNLSAKQKLALKNNETILVSSWPATIEMNRYQIATCVYQGVDVTTIKVKGFVPLVSETITFSLTDANKTKQELSWHDFFNTIDANYRDSLLPAIRDHIKNKKTEKVENIDVDRDEKEPFESIDQNLWNEKERVEKEEKEKIKKELIPIVNKERDEIRKKYEDLRALMTNVVFKDPRYNYSIERLRVDISKLYERQDDDYKSDLSVIDNDTLELIAFENRRNAINRKKEVYRDQWVEMKNRIEGKLKDFKTQEGQEVN